MCGEPGHLQAVGILRTMANMASKPQFLRDEVREVKFRLVWGLRPSHQCPVSHLKGVQTWRRVTHSSFEPHWTGCAKCSKTHSHTVPFTCSFVPTGLSRSGCFEHRILSGQRQVSAPAGPKPDFTTSRIGCCSRPTRCSTRPKMKLQPQLEWSHT